MARDAHAKEGNHEAGRFGPSLLVSATASRTTQAVPVGTRQPRRSLAVDNIVIYGEATVRVRGSAGAGGVCQRCGDSMLRVWDAERGGAVPNWA